MPTHEVCGGLVIHAPEWFARKDFRKFLKRYTTAKSERRVATWHRGGKKPGEFSDVFLVYDHGEGSEFDVLPEDIWEEICRLWKETQEYDYGLVWLHPLAEH